jgi:hypothetical protein
MIPSVNCEQTTRQTLHCYYRQFVFEISAIDWYNLVSNCIM